MGAEPPHPYSVCMCACLFYLNGNHVRTAPCRTGPSLSLPFLLRAVSTPTHVLAHSQHAPLHHRIPPMPLGDAAGDP